MGRKVKVGKKKQILEKVTEPLTTLLPEVPLTLISEDGMDVILRQIQNQRLTEPASRFNQRPFVSGLTVCYLNKKFFQTLNV